ncbi:MAG: hypothetical protein HRT44_13045, partial [Bdellovibrionales bacterium]|nr:hypothetical protein [Bdellovibrionales bacterium]
EDVNPDLVSSHRNAEKSLQEEMDKIFGDGGPMEDEDDCVEIECSEEYDFPNQQYETRE